MLGGSEFRLRQGFEPLAQNACTARKRRPAVRGPGFRRPEGGSTLPISTPNDEMLYSVA